MTLTDQPESDHITTNGEQPQRRTRGATKTRMAGHVGAGLHYKHVRTTIVLLKASTVFREFTLKEQAAFDEIQKLNYDLSAAKNITLEHVFAKLDDEVMTRVRAEFEFVRGLGSIRNHGGCVAVCALCGKGDSKDDGTNRDKLQYDFRLSNLSGGTELWVGENCIVNYALKVRGAETSEEARAILQRELREHISMWRKQQWRAEHIDHEDIPKHASAMREFGQQFSWYGRFRNQREAITRLGQDGDMIWRKTARAARQMRSVHRFYERAEYLTPTKEAAWREAKALLVSLRWLSNCLNEIANLPYRDQFARLDTLRRERENFITKLRERRVPRKLED